MWLYIINKVKVTHQAEGHIKVKVKYLHPFKFYVACTLCKWVVCIRLKCFLLGGLSLHLGHLLASHVTNYDWPFTSLPFGLFCQICTQRTLRHILGPILVIFVICHILTIQGPFWGLLRKSKFSQWRSNHYPLIGLVLHWRKDNKKVNWIMVYSSDWHTNLIGQTTMLKHGPQGNGTLN